MVLDGYAHEELVEIDASALHPRILYADLGKEFPGCPYNAILHELNVSEDFRPVAKHALCIAINTADQKAWRKSLRWHLISEGYQLDWLPFTLDQLLDALLKVHSGINLFSQNWISLHQRDSSVLIRTVNRLSTNRVPILPLHDALVVPHQHLSLTQKVFLEECLSEYGVSIPLRTTEL